MRINTHLDRITSLEFVTSKFFSLPVLRHVRLPAVALVGAQRVASPPQRRRVEDLRAGLTASSPPLRSFIEGQDCLPLGSATPGVSVAPSSQQTPPGAAPNNSAANP